MHISFLKETPLYGFYYAPYLEFLRQYPFLSDRACFDFYALFFFRGNGCSVFVNGQQVEVQTGRILLISPFTEFRLQSNEKECGSVLLFCKDFYAADFNSMHLLYLFSFFNPLRKDKTLYYLDLPEGDTDVSPVLSLLSSEYLGKNKVNSAIVRSCLNIIVQKLIRILNHAHADDIDSNLIVIEKISSLIERHYRDQRTVGFYARQTGVPEKQLNEICTRMLDAGLKELINERLMMEARKMLEQTRLTVSEIAFSLNFSDNSNFNKLFKAFTKITPGRYRKMHQRLLP